MCVPTALSWTHLIQLYKRVRCAVNALSLVGASEATLHLVTVQVFHRQMEVVRAVHAGPDPITQTRDRHKEMISCLNHKGIHNKVTRLLTVT